jgi:outer membrane protein OmpA-like peptidoglycan-associated protein
MNKNANPNPPGKFYNQTFQFGLKLKLFGKHVLGDSDGDGIVDKNDKCPSQVGLERYQGCPIPDTDADGVNDEEDSCATVAGLPKYHGCPIPDTDKDGVNDEQDKCPTVAGLAKYQGCPLQSDSDGVNDEEDSCATVAGLPKYHGCPVPDTDGDGVNDETDKCPTIAGVAENGGCPLIKFNAANVQFTSGTSTLTKGAKTELNKLVPIMNVQYPDIRISIEGHTDSTGKAETNLKLSEKRAASVKTYLVSKGISTGRLMTVGHGSEMPIESNKTSAGRAKNRRVEFKLSQ